MSRKKSKKAVKKVVSSEVRRVPSAFDDNLFMVPVSQKGSYFWPLLRFNFREHCPSDSENEFVDIDSFSDAAPEVQMEVVPDTAAEPPISATVAAAPQSVHPHDEPSPKFTKELELTIHRGEDPVQDAPLLEIREKVPEGQALSPSLAAFNKSFGTSHRGELLIVGFVAASIGNGAFKILTLWKSPTHLLMKQEKKPRNKLERSLNNLERDLIPLRGKLSHRWVNLIRIRGRRSPCKI
jgi:hypothetical protein